ncbi:hypothetical protein [Paenibacillus mesotrionivorans]|uniref:Uncharacterized protein n=1 Tax=Paenibacillus mesotrionivorans TaxID=3160968 RepID=A0ACC7P1P9_9BACL
MNAWKKLWMGTSVACLLLLVSACSNKDITESKHSPSPVPSATPTTQTQVNDHSLTEKDMMIGDLKIGQSPNEVKQKLGKPTEESISHGIGDPLWIYKEKGLELNLGEAVWAIRVNSPFLGKTPRDIGIGSTKIDVATAYPEAKEVKGNGDSQRLEQKSANNKYSIIFTLEKDKVTHIALTMDLVIK